jgi:hypothetical protein
MPSIAGVGVASVTAHRYTKRRKAQLRNHRKPFARKSSGVSQSEVHGFGQGDFASLTSRAFKLDLAALVGPYHAALRKIPAFRAWMTKSKDLAARV